MEGQARRRTKASASDKVGEHTERVFHWQEKLFGPQEVLRYSSEQPRGRQLSKTETFYYNQFRSRAALARERHDPDNGERDSAGLARAPAGRRIAALHAEIRPTMLFSYVDADSYVPPELVAHKVTASTLTSRSTLADAMLFMPQRNSGDRKVSIPREAQRLQAKLDREAPFKIMYIMAAVEVDAKAAQHRLGSSGRAKDDGIECHEEVLCEIRAYRSGRLEARPGFSEPMAEDGRDGASCFLDDEALATRDRLGPRLTTFRFTTARGSIYEYAVENVQEVADAGDAKVLDAAQEAASRKHAGARRKRTAASMHHDLSVLPCDVDADALVERPRRYPLALHVHVEVLSALGFGYRPVSVQLESLVPDAWFVQDEAIGAAQRAAGSSAEEQLGRAPPPTKGEKEAGAVVGVTQTAWPRGDATHGLGFDASVLQSERNTHAAHGSQIRGMAQGFLLFALLLAATLTCEARLLWLAYVAAMVAAGLGVTAPGAHHSTMSHAGAARRPGARSAYFGHLLSFVLRGSEEAGRRRPDGRSVATLPSPQLYFTVRVAHAASRHTVGGYGYVDIPQVAGVYKYNVACWRPSDCIVSRLHGFFLGGAGRSAHHTLAGRPVQGTQASNGRRSASAKSELRGRRKDAFLSRLGMVTERAGELQLRVHVAEKRPSCPRPAEVAGRSRAKSTATRRSLRDILEEYRSRARVRPRREPCADASVDERRNGSGARVQEYLRSRHKSVRERLADRRGAPDDGRPTSRCAPPPLAGAVSMASRASTSTGTAVQSQTV